MRTEDAQTNRVDGDSLLQQNAHTGHESHQHGHESHHEKPMSVEEAVRSLLLLGKVALEANDYESAAEAYASILKLEQNEVALYNLGSFYARGAGVKKDFMEAARLFRQAELLGNSRAGMLCRKCMLDYIQDDVESRTPAEVYAKMALFVSRVYPEANDQKQETINGLLAVANTLRSKGERAQATKVFCAATKPFD